MFTKFFAQDNATAKLSSWLILTTSVLSTISHGLHLSPTVNGVLLLIGGVFTLVAQFLQDNKVIARSSLYLLGYLVVDYVAHNQTLFPDANQVLLTLASVLALLTNFSKQSPSDHQPPTADPLHK